jgi:hypothetical protein
MNAQTSLKEAISTLERLKKAKKWQYFDYESQYHASLMIDGLKLILARYEHEAARVAKYRPPKKPATHYHY